MAKKKTRGGKLPPRPPKLVKTYFVLQQGGTSTEWYAEAYDTGEEASEAMRGHEEASYSSFGPFLLRTPHTLQVASDVRAMLELVAHELMRVE